MQIDLNYQRDKAATIFLHEVPPNAAISTTRDADGCLRVLIGDFRIFVFERDDK